MILSSITTANEAAKVVMLDLALAEITPIIRPLVVNYFYQDTGSDNDADQNLTSHGTVAAMIGKIIYLQKQKDIQ